MCIFFPAEISDIPGLIHSFAGARVVLDLGDNHDKKEGLLDTPRAFHVGPGPRIGRGERDSMAVN